MRTLNANLVAAQKSASRLPLVKLTLENLIGAVRRLDFQTANSAANSGAKHDCAVTDNNVLHRIRSDGGAIYYQRSLDFNTWTQLATARGSAVAIAAAGSRVLCVYNGAAPGAAIYVRESTDGGATFASETQITTAAASVVDLAAAYQDAAGDAAVAWVQTTTLHLILRTTGSWGSILNQGTVFATLNGVAMCKGLTYELVITGNEPATTKPTIWSLHYNTASATWSTPLIQVQGDSGITSFGAPSVDFAETRRVTFVEAQLFPSGYTRAFRTWTHPAVSWDSGAYNWRTPVPLNFADTTGIAIASGPSSTTSIWESALTFARAASQAAVTHDATARLLALEIHEDHASLRGVVDLDNADGFYASLPAAVKLGNLARVELGYKTPAGDLTSRLPDLYLAAYEFRRRGGLSTLRLHLESAWDQLARNTQRTAIATTGASYATLLARILARAGFNLAATNPSSRAQTVQPNHLIDAATSGLDAVRAILAAIPDRLYAIDGATMRLTEPLAGDTADYTFGGDHPLSLLEIRTEPDDVSEAHAFGAAVIGDDVDFDQAAHGLGRIARIRDLTSDTGAEADATAAAHRRQRQLTRHEGRIVAQPNVGLELMDVLQLSDNLVAGSDTPRRVTAIRWRYHADRPTFEQEVRLGPR